MRKQAGNKSGDLKRVVGICDHRATIVVFTLLPADGQGNVELAISIAVLTDHIVDNEFVVGELSVDDIAASIGINCAVRPVSGAEVKVDPVGRG